MRLKSLVITGFKSFADRTVFDFHSGVTGIVGPNGCGKSNVVDAVRWVLGETSAKALRGGEMADVIFNGTDKRKPLGMAEVILTFSDCEKQLGVDYNEVSIGRRVYRDGHSEYEMNGTPCRLKDISKLFMDTGVGRNMYSIMEQGKIDMLLSKAPEDRRQVFEEAAGITKSKAERKEALRKLEYTDSNMLRLADILSEMKRQVGSVQRQAAKARRWQEIHTDLKVLETHLLYKKHAEFGAERAELENSVQSLRLRQDELEEELNQEEAGLMDARAELEEMDAQLNSLRIQLNQITGQINAATHRIGFNHEKVRELEGLIAQNEEEVALGQERLLEQEEDIARVSAEIAQATRETEEKQIAAEEHGRAAAAVRDERAMLERRLQEARQAVHTSEGIIISAQAEMNTHTAQGEADAKRQDQLQRELDQLRTEREEKQREAEALRQRIQESQEQIGALQVDLSDREREAQEVSAEMEALQRAIHEQHRVVSERQSKADVLRQLISVGEGLEAGTQQVLRGFDQPDRTRVGIHGLLSTYLDVEPPYIAAVEAALGGHLQSVVVENAGLAGELLQVLKDGKLGYAAVLPKDFLTEDDAHPPKPLPEGAVAWALDKVNAPDMVRPVVRQLVGNVAIMPDLLGAMEAKRQFPHLAFATLDGEFISAEGTIRGGASADSAGSILHRQAELKSLEESLSAAKAALEELEGRRNSLTERQSALRSALAEQREIMQTLRVNESTLQGQASLVARELGQFSSKAEALQFEHAELLKRQEMLSRKMDEAAARRAKAEEELESRRREAAELVEELEIKRRAETEAVDQLSELRTAMAVAQRHLQALQEQQQPMQNRHRELQAAIGKRRNEIETYHEKIAAANEETQALTSGMAEAKTQVEELNAVIESRTAERSEKAQILSGRENHLNIARRQISKIAEQRGAEEVRITQISLRMESLESSARERYQVNLATFEQDAHALLKTITSQKALRSRAEKRRTAMEAKSDGEAAPTEQQASTQEEDGAIAENVAAVLREQTIGPDWEFVEMVVTELKQRIDSMGPVNLEAIAECEELEERFNFTQREFDDLQKAKAELLKIIERINVESRARFVETFEKIRANFRQTFKELFGATGQADLVLTNDDDPLESGVEVITKPPGKKPTSITLLSGGERSMTAVALLFSIYMVKPSPFCILDELDAPLDESNIGRFLRMLDKFIERSQFVIVTHNKRTMRRADVLYGVTMEEFGVSKPIGMKMSDSDRNEATAQDAAEAESIDAAVQAFAPLTEEEDGSGVLAAAMAESDSSKAPEAAWLGAALP